MYSSKVFRDGELVDEYLHPTLSVMEQAMVNKIKDEPFSNWDFTDVRHKIENALNLEVIPKRMRLESYLIEPHLDFGLVTVPSVYLNSSGFTRWEYPDDQTNLGRLYSDHASWIYLIVLDNFLVLKIGETSKKLGYRLNEGDQTPLSTDYRFGRLRGGCGDLKRNVDHNIRCNLYQYALEGRVSLWASKLEVVIKTLSIGGQKRNIYYRSNGSVEKTLLVSYKDEVGEPPILNKNLT